MGIRVIVRNNNAERAVTQLLGLMRRNKVRPPRNNDRFFVSKRRAEFLRKIGMPKTAWRNYIRSATAELQLDRQRRAMEAPKGLKTIYEWHARNEL